MSLLFDTHCHLDAAEFDPDRLTVIAQARQAGVRGILIPAVEPQNFRTVRDLAHQFDMGAYAIGIHPLFVHRASEDCLALMRRFIQDHLDDPKLVAIGEIGLDFFVAEISSADAREQQILFYRQQLRLAEEFGLPVLLHVRRSQDELLKWLRRSERIGGIAHAFNGSFQQAQQFIDLGFALGMGGALTYSRARQIRRLATQLALDNLVLETDAPDISPSWLQKAARNTPSEVSGVAQALAQLRSCCVEEVIALTAQTALRVLPRLRPIWQQTNNHQ
jgi:TatD DNase family protein